MESISRKNAHESNQFVCIVYGVGEEGCALAYSNPIDLARLFRAGYLDEKCGFIIVLGQGMMKNLPNGRMCL